MTRAEWIAAFTAAFDDLTGWQFTAREVQTEAEDAQAAWPDANPQRIAAVIAREWAVVA